MAQEFDVSSIVDIPVDPITEEIADQYNGTKVKVKSVTTGTAKSNYKDGERLPDGQFVEVPVVIVETDVFGKDAKGQPLSVKTNFNLQRTSEGKLGFSTSPKTKARKFMKMLKINRIEECLGKDVIIVKSVSKSGRNFLVMSIPE